MPHYVFECPSCNGRARKFWPIQSGPQPVRCVDCDFYMVQDFSSVQINACPVAFREENRVSDDERKLYHAEALRYEREAEALVAPPEKRTKIDMGEAYMKANYMFNNGQVRGVTFAQAQAEGIA